MLQGSNKRYPDLVPKFVINRVNVPISAPYTYVFLTMFEHRNCSSSTISSGITTSPANGMMDIV